MRLRAGRCAAAASHIKVEAQGEEKLEDLLDLGGAERLSIDIRFQWDVDKNIEILCNSPTQLPSLDPSPYLPSCLAS